MSGASGAVSKSANPAITSSAGGRTSAGGVASPPGTCASDRYSAKRTADRRSTAQPRIARKARPEGCGRRAPRSNQALMPARSNAFSTRPRYSRGERRKTAISSNRTPRFASSRIRRAISTHSRPSPGAEKSRTSPRGTRSGGWRAAKSDRRSAARSESPDGTRVSIGAPSVLEIVERREIAEGNSDQASPAPPRSAAWRARTRRQTPCGTSSRRSGRRATAAAPSQAAVKSAARPIAEAAVNCSSKASRSRARSDPPSGRSRSAGDSTPAMARSCSVRASARGNPGVPATAPK